MPKSTPSNAEVRQRRLLHDAMVATRDRLDDLPVGCTADIDGSLTAAEETFDELVDNIVHLAAAVTALREVPGLTVEGALVAGSADTALMVLRATLATLQATMDAARDDRAA